MKVKAWTVFCVIALGLLCGLVPVRARAAHFSGAYLLQLCGVDAQGHELVRGGHTACEAYIDGVLDYHSVLQSMHIAPSVDICVPREATSAQLHAIVLAYLTKNPINDAFIAAPAVTMALYQVYPCGGRRRR